jgi:hypothetical protein
MPGMHAERLKSARFHSFKSVTSRRNVFFLFPLLILVGALGCAVSRIVPIDASGPIELAPDEALLIIHIDTEVALESLVLNSRPVAWSLGKGRHIWMIRVREGRYHWKRIETRNDRRRRLKYQLDPDEELGFEVKAGKINYPGELSIRSGSPSWWGGGTLIVRNRNHSAMAVRELRGAYDALLRSLPLHYAGASGDGFLEFYAKKSAVTATESNGPAQRKDRVDSQSEAP